MSAEGAFRPAKPICEAELAELRHNARAPVRQILDSAETLIEDASAAGILVGLTALRNIHSSARAALKSINDALANRESIAQNEVELLFEKLRPRVERIAALTGELLREPETWVAPDWPQDLRRIHLAAHSILAALAPVWAAQLPEPPAPAEPQPGEELRGRVLVVDGNDAARRMLCRRLERLGYGSEESPNGGAAIDRIASERFDLVLLTLATPTMDAFEVLTKLKEGPGRSVPVVVVATNDDVNHLSRAIELGAEDFLLKPLHPIMLRVRIAAVLERARLREGLARRAAQE